VLTLLYVDVCSLRPVFFLKFLIWAIETNHCRCWSCQKTKQKPPNKLIGNCTHVQMKPEDSYPPCLPAGVVRDHHNLTGTFHFGRLQLLCRCFDITLSSRCRSSTQSPRSQFGNRRLAPCFTQRTSFKHPQWVHPGSSPSPLRQSDLLPNLLLLLS